jgi:ABC-type sugar transport system permease subunit
MFLTSLQTIPNELYEAATVDGASKGQKFRSITLPLMLPAAEISILLQGIWQFNSFNLSYLVTHGGPLNTTELLSVRIYNEAFISYNYGFASAISVVMLLVVLIPAIMYIRRTLKADNLSAM